VAAYFVVTRRRKACRLLSRQHGGARSGFDCFARQGSLSADRALWPPTSSSLADEKRVGSFLVSTAARDPVLIASLAKARCV
jgi:hypothetical protein